MTKQVTVPKRFSIITIFSILAIIFAGPASAAVGFGLYQPQTKPKPNTQVEVKGINYNSLFAAFLAAKDQISEQQLGLTDLNKMTTLSAFDSQVGLTFMPGTAQSPLTVDFKKVPADMPMPWNLKRVSPVYEFDIKDKQAYNLSTPLHLQVAYDKASDDFKQLYYYDKVKKAWNALPSTDFQDELSVKAMVHLSYAQVAVFANPDIMTSGKASWYAYKDGDFAASPDFPKGSRLRVTNLDNGKSLEVTINDWGPERDKFPDRVIDLDKEAFAKLADLGAGVINVAVSPIYIAPDSQGRVLGVKAEGLTAEPILTANSVAVVKSDGTPILYKSEARVAPIASLTKIMALSVFLGERQDLSSIVSYSTKDEDFNYQWVNKWESARVRLKDGDTLSINDLLHSALVGSANNAVETLVRVSGLSRVEFIAKMNQMAKDWGAKNTRFVEPTGLSPQNTSTAADYALLTGKVMQNEVIAKTSIEPFYVFFTRNTNERHRLTNTNKMISRAAQHYLRVDKHPIVGSKTGYLHEAGYCLLTEVEVGGENYSLVLLGAGDRETSFKEMADLIKFLEFKYDD